MPRFTDLLTSWFFINHGCHLRSRANQRPQRTAYRRFRLGAKRNESLIARVGKAASPHTIVASAPGSVCRKTADRPVTATGRSTEAPRLSASAGFALSDVRRLGHLSPSALSDAHQSDRAHSGDGVSECPSTQCRLMRSATSDPQVGRPRAFCSQAPARIRSAASRLPRGRSRRVRARSSSPALPSPQSRPGLGACSAAGWTAPARFRSPGSACHPDWGCRAGGVVELQPLHDVLPRRRATRRRPPRS